MEVTKGPKEKRAPYKNSALSKIRILTGLNIQ